MEYCGPRGLALSEFLAWPEGDQDAALTWLLRDRQRHRCGTFPDEWGGDGDDPYHPQIRVCPGCRMVELAEADLEKRKKAGEVTHGAHVVLVRGPEPFDMPDL